MTRSHFNLLVIVIVTSVTAQVCVAFNLPSKCTISTSLSAKHEHIIGDEDKSTSDAGRRRALSILSTAPLLVYQTASAQANVEVPAAPQISISSSATRLTCDSEEDNRIRVFERVAPSVVYIDTFAEKRDVFSTNV
jgi:hypothetical protein